jgi:hypothetical protein
MTTPTIAYVANTNNLELTGLKSELEGNYLNDATVTVTLKDAAGAEVTGGDGWPETMTYIEGSNGNYVIGLTHALVLLPGKKYTAIIDADGGSSGHERWGHWEFQFTAQTRTS